jgi:hypothetical protein
MFYTLSRKIGIIGITYSVSEKPNSVQIEWDTQQRNDILKASPELAGIADKVTLKELYARSRIISKLSEMVKNPEQTFGKIKSTMNAVWVNNAINNLKEVISGLTTDTNITNLWNRPINAWFKWWDGVNDTNVAVISGTNMTYRKFLSNVVGDSQLVASLFIGHEKAPESKDTEKIHQATRLGTFLLALENKYSDAEYKTMFRQAHEKLSKWDSDGARDIVRKTLKKEWNINIDQQATAQGHADLLRAIGATHEVGQVTVLSAKELTKKQESELKPEQQKLVAELGLRLPAEIQKSQSLAALKYQEMLAAIPESDPYKAQIIRWKIEIITELANEKAYITILDWYIGKNWSDGLGELYDVYNDMKGLKWFWNFSDENAKMTKEMAIMVASFALTAGIGPILSGIGIGARAITGANTLRATKLAVDAGRFRTGITAVSNGWKAVARGALVWTARVAEAGVAANNAVQASKLARIPWEALKFTTADALIREVTRGVWDQFGFKDFADKLALNGVMFGAFAGMEKFISGPILTKITQKFGIENAVATFSLNWVVLTAWDIGVMQALHAAETGKFEWDWMSAYQALAFRIGMKWTEKILPRLSAKFNDSKFGTSIRERAEIQKYANGQTRTELQKLWITIKDGKRISLGVTDRATLDVHGVLEPQARIAKAGELLGRKLNDVEQWALLKAYNNDISNISKWRTLMKDGKFSREDTQILIDKQLVGKGSNKDRPIKYVGEADKFIISKGYWSDLPKFQKEWYDLTEIWFEGWNVRQSQKDSISSYTLTHKEYGTHTFKSPKEVQEFLRNPNAPQVISPDIPTKSPEQGWVATQSIKSLIKRDTFVESQKSVDAVIQWVPKQEQIRNLMNNLWEKKLWLLDSLGLPGWKVLKLPQWNVRYNNVYELTIPGKEPIRIEGKDQLIQRIQQESRNIVETISAKESLVWVQPQAQKLIEYTRPFPHTEGLPRVTQPLKKWKESDSMDVEPRSLQPRQERLGNQIQKIPEPIAKDPKELNNWMKAAGIGIGAAVLVWGVLYLIDKNKKDEPVLIPVPDIPPTNEPVVPAPVPSAWPRWPRNPNALNEWSLERYNDRINKAITALIDSWDVDKLSLWNLLKTASGSKFTKSSVTALQTFMIDQWKDYPISKDGKPDGLFGDMTMNAIEQVVKLPNPVPTSAPAAPAVSPVPVPAPAVSPSPVLATPAPAIEMTPTIQMKPREIGDLIISLEKLKQSDYANNNHPIFFLNAYDIEILSKLNPANIKYMKDQLQQESQLETSNMTDQEKSERKPYWKWYITRLDAVIDTYKWELWKIRNWISNRDLELLKIADKALSQLNTVKKS